MHPERKRKKCPVCKSSQVYIRRKTKDMVCSDCGTVSSLTKKKEAA